MAPSRTKHPDIFAALAAPFEADQVKKKPVAGRQLRYITARTAMNRLDDVLGPENWSDSYVPGENSVLCTITIRLPDGSELSKSDAGGYAGMSDEGDDDKSGYSDAFKRASVKFGIARYLYGDGVPTFVHDAPPTPEPAGQPPGKGGAHDGEPAPPAAGEPAPRKPSAPRFKYAREMLLAKVAGAIGRYDAKLEEWGWTDRDRKDARKALAEHVHEFRLMNALITRATAPEVGLIDPGAVLGPGGKRDSRKCWEQLQKLYERRPGAVDKTADQIIGTKIDEALALALEGELMTQDTR